MELANSNDIEGSAEALPDKPETPVDGLARLPWQRQVAVMVGLAVSIAIGVAVVLWSQEPAYSPLFPNVTEADSGEIMDALTQLGIDYQIDTRSGLLLVPADKVSELRIKLATQGLPRTSGTGFELLDQDQGFGTSRFMEQKRYQRALEGELVRSIVALRPVQAARVHLAVPKQSVFVRNRKKPSASVVVTLFPGRVLEKGQVAAIVHMVASSIPEMESGQVTVVDQSGRVLTDKDRDSMMSMTAKQFEYSRQLEEHYVQRVEEILMPLVGADGVRAQVTADLDFTVTEQTEETYNPDMPAVRSEQTIEEQSRLDLPVGIPGALTNQPPGQAEAPEQAGGEEGGADSTPTRTSKRATRNFELDRTVSRSRRSPGRLRRLSVAVIVDDKVTAAADGTMTRTPLTGEELDRLTTLVKQAVGFNLQRGDSVNIMNAAFQLPAPPEPLPEPPIWEQPWFWNVAKQVMAGLLVLFLVFGVLRPTMRSLVAREEPEKPEDEAAREGAVMVEGQTVGPNGELIGADGQVLMGPDGQPLLASEQVAGADGNVLTADELAMLEGPAPYEKRLEIARRLVEDDPKRVAQLIKIWIAEDDG